jgi:hypothetical protein
MDDIEGKARMTIIKIGRRFFKRISEAQFMKIWDNTDFDYRGIFSFNDLDGEPVAYFKEVENYLNNKQHKRRKENVI